MKTKYTIEDDYKKFYIEKPDMDFSPERNRSVIANSIKKTNEMILKKKVEFKDDYMERSDAVIAYLRFADKKPGYRLDRFFEPKYITFLRGDDIRRELYARSKIYNNKGELITF